MSRKLLRRLVMGATFFFCGLVLVFLLRQLFMTSEAKLLSDPFLQLPQENSVRVVWFTEFPGSKHRVRYGSGLWKRTAEATTTKLSRVREDQESHVGEQKEKGQIYPQPIFRNIWRHEAEVTGLKPGERVPYSVISIAEDGSRAESEEFSLAPLPQPGTPLKILLTSDHQLKPMTAANMQKVVETVGRVDAVFLAGDLINIPDRASEWFDDNRGGAFFPVLQGLANYELTHKEQSTYYQGGAIIQNAPLYTALGNHEVMGRFDERESLGKQFNDPVPRDVARQIYQQNQNKINPKGDKQVERDWLSNNSFNTITYEELFTLPTSQPGGEKYYAVSFGDVRLVVLYATNIWRRPDMKDNVKGKYRESQEDINNIANWGYGQHIFEPIKKGSVQYQWLVQELNSSAFQQAKYRVVMLHHPPHSLGDNVVPPYTDPVQIIQRDETGQITSVRYRYPQEADYLVQDVMPLLERTGVELVYFGHSHVWNRFLSPTGMHFLESSNVGNTYGAYFGSNLRKIYLEFQDDYSVSGDPNGLLPITPNLAPLTNPQGRTTPYLASNKITAFSIFDTGRGTVSSYYFDTRKPDSPVVKFDEFKLGRNLSSLGMQLEGKQG